MSDGKVIIDTELDSKGAEKGVSTLSKTLSGIGKVGSVAFKGTAVAVGAATTAIGGLVVASTKAYASYEQLVGGVDTLFKDASGQVQKYAADAYKTAQLSSNQYMEQITGFSASLIQSLDGDTKKAAEYGNRAIIDMSDNANKMGTGIEMIQNAYQGFAKQNYTMLDNLKLGYGGTKTEMERLVKDASQMTDIQKKLGVTVDESSLSFGNIVNAISVMQESLGIAGTSQKEAATTIEGSLNMTKSAWENLVTGIADDNADFDLLIQNFVESAGALGENLMPRIQLALQGISSLIEQLAPSISEALPQLVESILPSLLSSGKDIVDGLITAISDNIGMILDIAGDAASTIVELAIELVTKLADAIYDNKDIILDKFSEIITKIGEAFDGTSFEGVGDVIKTLGENLDTIIPIVEAGTAAFIAFKVALGITSLIQSLVTAYTAAAASSSGLTVAQWALNAALSANPIGIIIGLIVALVAAFVVLWHKSESFRNFWITIWEAIKSAVSTVVTAIVDFFTKTIPEAFNKVIDFVKTNWVAMLTFLINPFAGLFLYFYNNNKKFHDFVNNAVEAIKQLPSKIQTWLSKTISNVASFFGKMLSTAKEKSSQFVHNVVDKLKELPDKVKDIGMNLVMGIWNGISDKFSWLTGQLKSFCSNVKDKLKSFFGIHSPSRVMRDEIGKFLAQGIYVGFNENDPMKQIKKDLKADISTLNGITMSAQNNLIGNVGIDYSKLAQANAEALQNANLGVTINGRQFGRVVREAI